MYSFVLQCFDAYIYTDLRSALEETDYGTFLQDEPSPLAVTTIATKCRAKMADEFRHLRSLANQPLLQFLDFIVYVSDIMCVILELSHFLCQQRRKND